ncbi:MAG: hypothetical protein J6A59_10385 [Lachnospiraceae bacterium]|nr:hypothetical protein [Lachnospiraceae bacterium]
MGITNFESNILTMIHLMKYHSDGEVLIKRINTGSYIYYIMANHTNGVLKYSVHKTRVNGQAIGTINVNKISIFGMEYDNSKGSLPDSVTIEIMTFHKELMRRTGNYK